MRGPQLHVRGAHLHVHGAHLHVRGAQLHVRGTLLRACGTQKHQQKPDFSGQSLTGNINGHRFGGRPLTAYRSLMTDLLVAHTGLEPVISALRGQRVNQLHQCAVVRIIGALLESWQT